MKEVPKGEPESYDKVVKERDYYKARTEELKNVVKIQEQNLTKREEEIEALLETLESHEQYFSEEAFKKDQDRLRFYTGLACFETSMCLLLLIKSELPPRRRTSTFTVLLMTLMTLRHNYPYYNQNLTKLMV